MVIPRRLVSLCVGLVALLLAVPLASAPKRFSGRVVGVHDGDTISVLAGRHPVKVRLEGIDCPELSQPYGRVAKLFTSERVFGKTVDVRQTTIDRHGRSVARVLVGGEDLSALILGAGLAWHYTQYSNDRTLDAAEQSARAAHRGLWSQPSPTPPWVYRRPPVARASSAPAAPPPRSATAGPFHGNVQTRVFHAPGCPNYDCKHCTAVFATREDAIALGYKPAHECPGSGLK